MSDISVVIPVSPIKSHPETDILRETVASVRHHLPDAEIFVCFDGVRPEQEDRRQDYEEHMRRVLWAADKNDWMHPVVPYRFEDHQHQTGMLRAVLDDIRTPLMLFVEADTPLVTDEPIDWDALKHFLMTGESNLIRLHHEALILEPHKHLMHGVDRIGGDTWEGRRAEFIRTSQWSQRPHIASVAYYRRIMQAHFTPNAKAFIEDRMHSVLQVAFNADGINGWMQHRVHIYDPGSGNMKRSVHSDGRAGERKYDETQVW